MENREERREEIREEKREERHEEKREHLPNQKAEELRADGKNQHNHSTRRINRLWLWLGVLILIFILVWWLWTIGMAEDETGVTNGVSQMIGFFSDSIRIV